MGRLTVGVPSRQFRMDTTELTSENLTLEGKATYSAL